MEIHETVVLRYRNGPKITVPTGLLQTDPDGKRWLRLRASNVNIARLVLGHMEAAKKVQNPSLAASPQLKSISDKIKEAVLTMQEQYNIEEHGANPFEEGQEGQQCVEQKGKNLRQALQKAPTTVSIQLGSSWVELKKPNTWKESDIVIPLEASALTAVLDYIMVDVDDCFKTEKKRSYVKSGAYCKRQKLGSESEE